MGGVVRAAITTGWISSTFLDSGRMCRLPPAMEMTRCLRFCPRVASLSSCASLMRWGFMTKGWTAGSMIRKRAGRARESGRPTAREHLFTPKAAKGRRARYYIFSSGLIHSRSKWDVMKSRSHQSDDRSNQQQRAARSLDYAHESGRELWPRNADFHKTSHTQKIREQELLDAFGQKHPPTRTRISKIAFAAWFAQDTSMF